MTAQLYPGDFNWSSPGPEAKGPVIQKAKLGVDFQPWIERSLEGSVHVPPRVLGKIDRWRKGENTPNFRGFLEIVGALDPYFAGVLEAFLVGADEPPEDSTLCPERGKELFKQWLCRRLSLKASNVHAFAKEFAEAGTVSKAAVYYWATGRTTPNLTNFLKLVETLDNALFEQIQEVLATGEEE